MDLYVFAGADNQFTLYEDNDKEGGSQRKAFTDFAFHWGKTCSLKIGAARGDAEIIMGSRSYTVHLCGMKDASKIEVLQIGQPIVFEKLYYPGSHTVCISLKNCPTDSDITIRIAEPQTAQNDIRELCYRLLDQAQIEYNLKNKIYQTICSETDLARIFGTLQTLHMHTDLFGAICEILTA